MWICSANPGSCSRSSFSQCLMTSSADGHYDSPKHKDVLESKLNQCVIEILSWLQTLDVCTADVNGASPRRRIYQNTNHTDHEQRYARYMQITHSSSSGIDDLGAGASLFRDRLVLRVTRAG